MNISRLTQKITTQGREIGRLKHQVKDLKMMSSDKHLLLLENKDNYIHKLEVDNKEKDNEIKLLENEIEELKKEISYLLIEDINMIEESKINYIYKDKIYMLVSDDALIQADGVWIEAIIYTNDTGTKFVRGAEEFYDKFKRVSNV